MDAIEVKDLFFSYGDDEVLHGVSFSLREGSYVSIIGPNGSGKSTLAKLIIGLLEKKSGSIKVFGEELTEESVYRIREKIGIVFQNPDNQFIGTTVRDDIAFGLENHCLAHELMDPAIEAYSKKVGMHDYLESEPSKLSGGQKQRVAIAGVLAMMPEILIFDEATSMLDPEGKRTINRLIDSIHDERRLTIISITHDIEEAVNSDEVLIMDQGRIALAGKPEAVLGDRKELGKHQLAVPFAAAMGERLAQQGIKVRRCLSIEALAEEICQSASAK